MSSKSFRYNPIIPGFPWDAILRIQSKTPFFVEGARYRAELRVNENSPVLATISTEAGGIVGVDSERIQVILTGAQTSMLRSDGVFFDIVRTDGPFPVHTNLRVHVKVKKTMTAAHAAV
jgi:hypothetical protein